MARPTEKLVEDVAEVYFGTVGVETRSGAAIDDAGERETSAECVLTNRLVRALARLNPHLPIQVIEDVARQLSRPPHASPVENNRWLHRLLLDGVPVQYEDPETEEARGDFARVLDFEDAAGNDFVLVRQLTVVGTDGRSIRPDLVLFVNGLPLVVIELKDPTDTSADLASAIEQLRRYMAAAPDLFVPNALLAVSDGMLTRTGSITSGASRFVPWRNAAGATPSLEGLIRGLLAPELLIDYLRHCVVFDEDERGEVSKKVGAYHQFRAMREARASVLASLKPPIGEGDGRAGVVWHTQGSGKSLTMLMLAGALVGEALLANPTLVLITDRNDLDDQLFDTFAGGRDLLRQAPVQAASRAHLAELLDHAAGGVVFTTIQKFADEVGVISDRANVVVIADEAHRSQYGFVDGGARWMREALPNATYVGFTGTPLERDDKNTPHVFGSYVDVYDIRQAVEDGATTPLFYESRIVALKVDEEGARAAEKEIERVATEDESGSSSSAVSVPLEAVVGAPERQERLASFVVDHWEERRSAMEGKAMIVTMSREVAANLYEVIRRLRPEWHADDDDSGVVKAVYTGSANDSDLVSSHVRSKSARRALAERFKNPADDFRIVIVCDMWLTGFDCPPAHTMYIDKPLAGHNLMQAIARVNRVYGDKPAGLIVDLLGLADQLADALATYSNAGGTGQGVRDVQGEAVPLMLAAHEKLRSFFHGFDLSSVRDAADRRVLELYLGAADHVFAQEDGWPRFRQLVKELSAAFALAVPRLETAQIADELAFFQRVAAMIRKSFDEEPDNASRSKEADVDAAVRQVIGGAIQAGEVIDLFAAAGLEEARLDILSDDFLRRVAALDQKNLALETLRKLLADEIRATERTNLVQSRDFREALEGAMVQYTNKSITTAEMLVRLIELARFVRDAQARGEELGLSDDEAAFYDALADNESAREAMEIDALRLMARELTEMVRRLPKLDWTQRESVRADLRRSVRRLLARYGYPPDMADEATQLVLKQAELSTQASS